MTREIVIVDGEFAVEALDSEESVVASRNPKIAEIVSASEVGEYIRFGEYLFMVLKSSFEKLNSGRCMINEFLVLESRASSAVLSAVREPNPEGSKCFFVINFDGIGRRSAEAQAKAFVCGLLGIDGNYPNAESAATFSALTGSRQPARGLLVECSATPRALRTRPEQYVTSLRWECVDPPGVGFNTASQVEARLAVLKSR